MIKLALFILTLGLTTACALSPEYIAGQIEECETYDLVPAVTVRNDKIKRVNCLPPNDRGYVIIEKGLEIGQIPKLPRIK